MSFLFLGKIWPIFTGKLAVRDREGTPSYPPPFLGKYLKLQKRSGKMLDNKIWGNPNKNGTVTVEGFIYRDFWRHTEDPNPG